MKYFVVIAIVLILSFFGYRYFNGKKALPHTSSGSEGSSVSVAPKVVNNNVKPDSMKEINELSKKADEWKRMFAQMKTFLNSVSKEMQETPNKNKEVQ